MSAIRSLLARVARLEQAKVSPLLRLIGTSEEFAAMIQAGADAGIYDRRDMEVSCPVSLAGRENGMWKYVLIRRFQNIFQVNSVS